MPILNDIMHHDLLGPAIRQGLEQGRLEALRSVVRRLLDKSFGPIPAPIETRLMSLSVPELDAFTLPILDAATLEDLFANP